VLHCNLLIWKGKPAPEGTVSHVIALVENGVKNYELDKITHRTRPSEICLIPRVDKKDPMPCFQVGSAKIAWLSNYLKDSCVLTEKSKVHMYMPNGLEEEAEVTSDG